jgi:nucleotide-binding universal stress UspA family protein
MAVPHPSRHPEGRQKGDSMTAQAVSNHPRAAGNDRGTPGRETTVAPIVAAIDGSSASKRAGEASIRFARTLNAPIVFVYVRRGPASFLGSPEYQRRLTSKMAEARKVLDDALKSAADAGVDAGAEILEGSPQRRIAEFAKDRGAQLVVLGSRRRKLGRSVSSGVARAADRPVVVTPAVMRLAAAAKAA